MSCWPFLGTLPQPAKATTDLLAQPVVPSDKSTTVQLLLHNTQTTLEGFTDSISGLVEGVKDATSQVHTIKLQFQQDRESLRDELETQGAAYMHISNTADSQRSLV